MLGDRSGDDRGHPAAEDFPGADNQTRYQCHQPDRCGLGRDRACDNGQGSEVEHGRPEQQAKEHRHAGRTGMGERPQEDRCQDEREQDRFAADEVGNGGQAQLAKEPPKPIAEVTKPMSWASA